MAASLSRPRRWRLQFSLATIFVLMTLSAIGTWFWYQRPFENENREFVRPDPFSGGVGPPAAALLRRDVESVRRVWGGKTVRHGQRRVYDGNGKLLLAENYRNGQEDGEFIEYYPSGDKKSLITYVRGQQHGPSRRWANKGGLLAEEHYSRS